MIIPVKTSLGGYDIVLERGALSKIGNILDLSGKTLIVTDDGVPMEYSDTVVSQCENAYKVILPQGEASKNIKNFEYLLSKLVEYKFTRTDRIIAVGGGVIGDLSGFTASAYMRGIDFINIPTTLLSQVDSSVGGKTAIDFMGIKNVVGAFYPPKKVLIDPDTLKTLDKRQVSNGLAEVLKMSLTHDKELFDIFENEDAFQSIDKIIERSILFKKSVVEADERESGLRRVLNFGHTLAHGIESGDGFFKYLHGECVAMGMIPMCNNSIRARLINVLKKLNLPTDLKDIDIDAAIIASAHDKKLSGSDITLVLVEEIGSYELKKMPFAEYEKIIREVVL